MRAIRKRCFVFGAFTGFFILVGSILLVFGKAASEIQTQILLASVIIASGISAGFWIRERGKLKVARLIEVIVSYFGILLDEKTIKFNQDGIRLKAVEIGNDFISFTYGTEKRTQYIRLLRPAIDPATLEQICERFRYEIGIAPTLLS